MYVASSSWVLAERQTTTNLLSAEREELVYPVKQDLDWLNEHIREIFNNTTVNITKAFQTPGRLRNGKTPKTIVKSFKRMLATKKNILATHNGEIEPLLASQNQNCNTVTATQDGQVLSNDYIATPTKPQEVEIPATKIFAGPPLPREEKSREAEPAQEFDNVTREQEPGDMDIDVRPTQQSPASSPVRMYNESEIGSPSSAATPEKPLRKASFTFAPLPEREPMKQSLGAPTTAQNTREQSLGLDSDDSDDESVDLRAPELIAHEERMKAYESSPQPAPKPVKIVENTVEMPGTYPSLDELEKEPRVPTPPPAQRRTRSSVKRATEENTQQDGLSAATTMPEETIEAAKPQEKELAVPKPQTSTRTITNRETGAERSRLRAPKPLGRPVRPTNTAAQTNPQKPVAIKIKPLSHPKPVNTASVAVHNQEAVRAESQQPELRKKASAQSVTTSTTSFLNKPVKPALAPSKALLKAQKKKELDEKAAEKDAATKRQQQERRDAKIEEIQRKKREEQTLPDHKTKENSAEKSKKRVIHMDNREVKRSKSEERQEREEAALAAKKASNKERILTKVNVTAVSSARPMNSPTRPPARLDFNEAPRPVSRIDLADDDMSDHEITPTNTPEDKQRTSPDRESSQQPTRLGAALYQHNLQRQTQQENDLPAYPSNLSKPPVRVSNLGKKPSLYHTAVTQTQTQAGPSNMNFPQPPSRGPQMQQFATARIPFATEMPTAAQQPPRPNSVMGSHQTIPRVAQAPQQPQMYSMQTIQAVHTTSPSALSLPEIHTDSSDSSSGDVDLPSWATPGHIFNQLSVQETINTDNIFPRLQASISMDDVFASNPDRLRRLRIRTSSANWIRTGDALTQVEVIEDRLGREQIRLHGGWYYGAGNASALRTPSTNIRTPSGRTMQSISEV